MIYGEDMTAHLLEERYWPSFNVAYFNETRAVAGERSSWTDCTRAKLFREMQGNVTDDATMAWIMGWNNYANDPISKVSQCHP